MVDGELDLEKEPLDDNSGDESSISDVESLYFISLHFRTHLILLNGYNTNIGCLF